MLNFIASERHYYDHLRPIHKSLGGTFYVSKDIADYCEGVVYEKVAELKEVEGYAVVSSFRDLENTRHRGLKQILCEHGAGQTYKDADCGSYANSLTGKDNVVLYLAVNEHSANAWREISDIPCEVIGCPKLDALIGISSYTRKSPPVIAIGFHWDCHVAPESRSSFYWYKDILPELAKRYHTIGHGHPRIIDEIEPFYKDAGIPVERDFSRVCEVADLYITDNSSTLFEFAALGRPVVVLNCPHYRKDVHHGLRFWDYADLGPQVDRPFALFEAIAYAMSGDYDDKRREAVSGVYPYLGSSTERAADIIRRFINGNYNA